MSNNLEAIGLLEELLGLRWLVSQLLVGRFRSLGRGEARDRG